MIFLSKYIVYKRTNKINGKMYIGQTCQTLDKRWANGKGYRHCRKFNAAIEKYGVNNFIHEVLKDNLTQQEADYWEQYFINKYDSVNQGYNLKTGNSHCVYSEESKQKMSKNHANVSSENNPMYGKKHSTATRKKMSQNRHDKTGADSCFAKKVRCINTGEVFGCMKDAAQYAGLTSHSAISMCVNHKRNYAGKHPITHEKLQWEYYIEK